MIKANIVLDKKIWKKKLKKPEIYFKKKLNKLSKFSTFKKKKQEFTVMLTNNKKMKDLNYKFRKKKKITDILSFRSKERTYIGDIAISYEMINKRSKSSNFFLEFDKIWIHGYFHLIGYDHKKLKDFKKMTKKENLVLNYFHKIN